MRYRITTGHLSFAGRLFLQKTGLVLGLWLSACGPGILSAQAGQYPFNFDYLSKDNGLPHNYCHTALRDRRGFLWFGTQDGLARYDGVRFKVYPYREDSTGLSAPTVLDLEEDADGKLWIATIGGGLDRFDPVSETFKWFRNDPRDSTTLPGNDLTNLLIDRDGSIWVGGLSSGLSNLDPATGQCRNYALAENLTTADDRFHRNSVQDIARDSEDPNVLWLAANNGIFRFHKQSGQFDYYPAKTPCHDVLSDTPGIVWVATDGGGIALVDKKSGEWNFYPHLEKEWKQGNLSTNLIADISRKSDRELWVASLDQGFGIFNLLTREYTFFNTQSKLLAGQTTQSANGLYRDPAGLLWIFNNKNGISLLAPASNIFDYTSMPAGGCQNPQINEPQDFAWNAGTRELYVVSNGCRGFYVFEPVKRVEPVQLSGQSPYQCKKVVTPAGEQTVSFQRVLIDRRGRVWVGAQPGNTGVSLYNYLPKAGRLQPFRQGGAAAGLLHRFPVNDLAEDHAGIIWVATTGGGLFRLDPEHSDTRQILRGGDFEGTRMQIVDLVCLSAPAEVPNPTAYPAEQAQVEEQVWFSTKEAGVFCYYPILNKFIRYGHRPGAREGLVEDYVTALERGTESSVWVATASQGLQQIPLGAPANAVFPHFTVKDGLAFNSIHRLTTTPAGQLWVATEKGISVFQPESGAFFTYDERDGLADTYLSRTGFRWCANGAIFVGQSQGFYSFRPDALYRDTAAPVLAFTGFDLLGQPYSTGTDLNFKPEVCLAHNQNFFTIHFAALSFDQSNRVNYTYQLEEIDPGWVKSGHRAEAPYTHVPPGKYLFRVRAETYSGVPSARELTMTVVIMPAFYQTWWFRILVLAIIVAAIIAFFRIRLAYLLQQEAAKNELNRLRAVKAELENKALRAQMNPHFIFNALNTIEALIIEEKPDAASALLQKFSKLVRLVLENSQQHLVPLSHELEALELYLQLEAIRLDHRFEYQIELDPRLERQHCQLPPLILQPFVENAILHGLRHLRDRKGRLDIRLDLIDQPQAEGDRRMLRCRIADNGIGRPAAAEINVRRQISGKKRSLGTRLTAERVDLLNTPGQKAYSVEITDLAGENGTGTLVTLILPLNEKANNKDGEHEETILGT